MGFHTERVQSYFDPVLISTDGLITTCSDSDHTHTHKQVQIAHVLPTQHLAAGVCVSVNGLHCVQHANHTQSVCARVCMCVLVWGLSGRPAIIAERCLHSSPCLPYCITLPLKEPLWSLSLCECAWLMNVVEMSRISAHATPALTSEYTPEHEHTHTHTHWCWKLSHYVMHTLTFTVAGCAFYGVVLSWCQISSLSQMCLLKFLGRNKYKQSGQ